MDIRIPFAQWLDEEARLFHTLEGHESGNASYGFLDENGASYFAKFAPNNNPLAIDRLKTARQLSRDVRHPALIPCVAEVRALDGYAIVYPWAEGETLSEQTGSLHDKYAPDSALMRFRALPVQQVSAAVRQLLALHVMLEQHGYISGNWHEGRMHYDFESARVYAVGLGHYHKGAFVNTQGRMPGSSRYMAPEEWQLGATIDRRTMVYHMGATILNLLGDGIRGERSAFRGNTEQWHSARMAVSADPAYRQQNVSDLYAGMYFRHR